MQKQTKNDKSRQPPKDKQTNFLNQNMKNNQKVIQIEKFKVFLVQKNHLRL